MLRDITLLLLALGALSAGLAHDFKTASAFVLVAGLIYYAAKQSHKHSVKVEFELTVASTKLLNIALASMAVIALIGLLADIGSTAILLLIASAVAACAPNSLSTVFHTRLVRKSEHANYRSFQKIGRSALSTSAAALSLAAISTIGLALLHLLPAMTAIQFLLLDIVVLVLPLSALHKDINQGAQLEAAHIEHGHVVGHSAWANFVGFGLLAGALTYANYLFFFVRINLAPDYLDSTLPQYHQATTVALVTLALCSWSYLLFERAYTHHKFFTEHLTSNKRLLKSFALSLFIIALIIYVPLLQNYFGTEALSFIDWISAVFTAGLYSLARISQRYTRNHSRQSVIKLHKIV